MLKDRIASKEQYKSILSTAKQKNYRLSNCYLMPAEVNSKVSGNNFYVSMIPGGYLLLEDVGDFYRCWYFLDENEVQHPVQMDKDAVVEIPYTNAFNETQLLQVQRIKEMGFHLGRESGLMTATHEQMEAVSSNRSHSDIVRMAKIQEAEQILALLNGAFNPMYSYLPDLTEIKEQIKKDRVFVIEKDGVVAGAINSSFNLNKACINQIVIHADYRGNGYGNELLDFYHKYYLHEAKVFQHWVDLSNIRAISMYQKNGYVFAARKANEYIKLSGGTER